MKNCCRSALTEYSVTLRFVRRAIVQDAKRAQVLSGEQKLSSSEVYKHASFGIVDHCCQIEKNIIVS